MMARKWLAAAVVCVVATVGILRTATVRSASLDCSSDVACAWNDLALATARAAVLNDARSARLLAMVNVAMYDAVNGILSRHGGRNDREPALVSDTGVNPRGDIEEAAAAAAHAVLSGEFPQFTAQFPDGSPGYDARLDGDLADRRNGKKSPGALWGASVGARVRELRTGDSVTIAQAALPSPSAPGLFQPAWSGLNIKPFAIANPDIYVGSGPPAFDGLDYAAAFAEVKIVGDAAKPDAAKLDTFRFWSLGNGTSQPPGAWIQMALIVTKDGPALPEKTRLLALLAMALADTVGPTTVTKAAYRHWRPTAAIVRGDEDPNPFTEGQPTWVQRGTAATSPEYWSGHSSFAGAGAAVLAGFFCNDNIPIVGFQSDSALAAGIPARDYPSFSAAGAEMGLSRIVGGLHFAFSNRDGIAVGRAIAEEILANKLLRTSGATHFGACPR
jgi:PAP2 superfamily protein